MILIHYKLPKLERFDNVWQLNMFYYSLILPHFETEAHPHSSCAYLFWLEWCIFSLQISDDCAALVKENAALSSQVLELQKQLDAVCSPIVLWFNYAYPSTRQFIFDISKGHLSWHPCEKLISVIDIKNNVKRQCDKYYKNYHF